MRGQGLTGVAYSTNFADFGFELYIANNGQAQSVTSDPVLASPRMAITPAGSAQNTSPVALSVTGGTPTVTYNWTLQGTIPTGVSLSSATGATTNLVFTSATPIGSPVTVRCTNGTGPEFTEETYTLNFGGGGGGGTLNIDTATLPNGQVTVPYNAPIVASGTATGPFAWSLAGGTLPGGLVLDTSSTTLSTSLAGTPTAAGNFTFTVQITNGSVTDPQSYNVDITAAGVLTITTTSLTNGTSGTPYLGGTINSVGGTGAHTWSISSGTLPAGLTLGASTTATVSITGTPTASGTFPFTVMVTDSSGPAQNDTQAFSLVINTGGGGPGPGPIGGGGGGGGGGCATGSSTAPWMLAIGLLALCGLAVRSRTRKV